MSVDPLPTATPDDVRTIVACYGLIPAHPDDPQAELAAYADLLEREGDNWLITLFEMASVEQQWTRERWLFHYDQLTAWRKNQLQGATFWRRTVNYCLQSIITLLKEQD